MFSIFIISVSSLVAACLGQTTMAPAPPVSVTTYLETLCPDSRNFVRNQLSPTYDDLKSIMEVDIFAYGKITETFDGTNYTFDCQHGPDECEGNKMLDCAQKYIPDHDTYINFAICVMSSRIPQPTPPFAGEECANGVPTINFDQIEACQNSTEGDQLLHEVGVQQDKLDPTLYYVPWIIIDGVWSAENLDAAQVDLRALVCDTYTGTKPAACTV